MHGVRVQNYVLQVDIGQGCKPPGHYVQRSCGLFPAPYPQNSPEIEHVCKLFEVLGIFIAKCIQDKRRVDLPLARPFFKLMATTVGPQEQQQEGERDDAEGETEQARNNNEQLTTGEEENDSRQGERGEESNVSRRLTPPLSQRPNSRGNRNDMVGTDEGAATSSKEAELQMLVTRDEDEITKDRGGEKEDLLVLEELGDGGGGEPDAAWFEGILQMEDLEEVNPHR